MTVATSLKGKRKSFVLLATSMQTSFKTRLVASLISVCGLVLVHAQDFVYTTNNGVLTITGYPGSGPMIIPQAINGVPVVGIGNWAFYDRTDLTSVVIPN